MKSKILHIGNLKSLIELLFVLLIISANNSYSQSYAIKDGVVKLEVVKGLRIDVEPQELFLGIFPQGTFKQLSPAETMVFTINGHENAAISCNIISMEEVSTSSQNDVKIGISHSALPDVLDSNGEAEIQITVDSIEIGENANSGTHLFNQEISVEYTGL